MQITINRDLQNNFRAGLQIAGESEDGELLWMGDEKAWADSELDLIDLQKQESKEREYKSLKG